MKKQSLIFACFLFLSFYSFGQENLATDSLTVVDSIITESATLEKVKKNGPIKSFFKKGYPDPKKAMICSIVLPGAGQLYNKKYWKVPIVWGAYGLMIYFIDFSSGEYKFFKQEYITVVNGGESPLTLIGYGADDIKFYRDLYRKRMELSYIGLFAVALLSGVDAFVDAHLKGFNVSEDLTMRVKPKVDFMPFEGSTLGIGFNFQLNNKDIQPKVFFNAN
jgi:hypothetical protein